MAFPPSLPFVSFRLSPFPLCPPSHHFSSARHLSISPLLTSRYSASPTHFSRSSLLPNFPIKKARPPARLYFFAEFFRLSPQSSPSAAPMRILSPKPLLYTASQQHHSHTPPHNSPAIKKGIPQTPLYSHIKNNVRRTAPMHVPASSAASRPEQRKYISAAKTYAAA